jgi:FKBP-type peptidyl-prolyl cis-trans isomerase
VSKRLSRWLIVGLVLIALISLVGCSSAPPASTPKATISEQPTAAPESAPASSPGKTADVTELKIEDLVVGKGAVAKSGKTVTVNYTGWLTDGTKFDSSLDSGTPFAFALGQGQVIKGWDQGVAGMKVGGKRRLTIPPALGYGAEGAGGVIPPNATLVFEVDLLGVK